MDRKEGVEKFPNTATADALVKQALGSDRFSDLVCVQTPVYRDAVDIETGGAVDGSETVVERVYHYFNTQWDTNFRCIYRSRR